MWCQFESSQIPEQTSPEVGYYRINLKTVSCCTKAAKTFYQDTIIRLTEPYTTPCNLQNFSAWLQQQIVL